jgi:hypothetical protein
MYGPVPPFCQYALIAWFSVKMKAQGQLYLYLTEARSFLPLYEEGEVRLG